ncbi:MAG: hypothetical protein AAF443_03340 [Chlamydiota bacterium]
MQLSTYLSYALLTTTFSLGADTPATATPLPQPSNEEKFMERMIAEFWKDEDYDLVKKKIQLFMDQYPDSQLKGHFQGVLAEIYFKEEKFESALKMYSDIEDIVVVEKTIVNKLHCYYALNQFQKLTEEARPFIERPIPELEPRREELFFLMAEALFRNSLEEKDFSAQQALAQEAQKYYHQIDKPEYQASKELSLAEIAFILEKNEEAARAYHELAAKHFDQKEDLLFKAALAEAKFNAAKAAETFATIQSLKGHRANEALFNQIIILFQAENYEEVISLSEKIAPQVPDNLQPTFQFIVGKSYFSLDQYREAIGPMGTYIAAQSEPCDQLKNALLIQMNCAHYLNDEALFHASFDRLTTLFPDDSEIPKALFMHAMMLKEKGDLALAEEKLRQIKDDYPAFEDQESFLFEYGFLAYQNERWADSHHAFKTYLAQFPEGSRLEASWKLFLSAAVNRYKQSLEENQALYPKTAFFEDLTLVLSQRQFFREREWIDYIILHAKVSYELNYFEETIRSLQDHIFTATLEEATLSDLNDALAEAHYIAALCYSHLKSNYSAFCMHLEKTLDLNPNLYNSATIRKQLFNAYISLAGFGAEEAESLKNSEQRALCIKQAAAHLYAVVAEKEVPVKQENLLWLANYYYDQATTYFDRHGAYRENPPSEIFTAVERASEQYQTILYVNNQLVPLTVENSQLEVECIKWAKVLGYQGKYREKLSLLEALINQQNRSSQIEWKGTQEALFELALTYLSLNRKEEALETFAFIDQSPARFPTVISNTATLQAAQLQFQLIDKEIKTESNPKISKIFNDLKDLQICKSSIDFPNHLEAALTYAEIRAALAKPEERDSRYGFFLIRMKEDFNAKDDPITQSYLTEIDQSEGKKQAFDAYMTFIRAEKFRLDAKSKSHENKMNEMEEINEKALALYDEIKTNTYTPKPLFNRVLRSIEKINTLTAYH